MFSMSVGQYLSFNVQLVRISKFVGVLLRKYCVQVTDLPPTISMPIWQTHSHSGASTPLRSTHLELCGHGPLSTHGEAQWSRSHRFTTRRSTMSWRKRLGFRSAISSCWITMNLDHWSLLLVRHLHPRVAKQVDLGLREGSRQSQAEVIGKTRMKIHQTWGPLFWQ